MPCSFEFKLDLSKTLISEWEGKGSFIKTKFIDIMVHENFKFFETNNLKLRSN
jgi:hypothetical protein